MDFIEVNIIRAEKALFLYLMVFKFLSLEISHHYLICICLHEIGCLESTSCFAVFFATVSFSLKLHVSFLSTATSCPLCIILIDKTEFLLIFFSAFQLPW